MDIQRRLFGIYKDLNEFFGHRKWWPAETPFEVCVGAILTQNTSWVNVEKAIARIKNAGLMNPGALLDADIPGIAELIRPAGYYNIKAGRLHAFLTVFVNDFSGNIEEIGRLGPVEARKLLLDIRGIGNETADSILLYALNMPVFVVDAYTIRIFSRMGFFSPSEKYETVQKFFTENLPAESEFFNDYHAQIVELGKTFCAKKRPGCEKCPVKGRCARKGVIACSDG